MLPASGGNLSGGCNSAGSSSYDLTSSGILLELNFFKVHFIGWSPSLHVPTNISGNENVTLQVDIEKNSMGSDVTNFYHQDKYDHYYESGETGISANVMNIAKNYTPPGSEILFTVTRTVSKQEIIGEGEQLKKMPGFKITWDFKNGNFNSENFYYKHEDSKSDSNFKTRTSAFVRKMLYCFKLFDFLLFFSSFI